MHIFAFRMGSTLSPGVVLLWTMISAAQADHQPGHADGDEAVRIRAAKVIDELVNKNPQPAFRKDQRVPEFGESYDLSEDQRVWGNLRQLARKCDSMLPSLVDHFDDGRYCITASTSSGKVVMLTVGDACHAVVADAIAEGYLRHVRPQPKQLLSQFRNTGIGSKEKLREWCKERDGKPLYVLQVETCDWAIGRLKRGEITRASAETVRKWIGAIEAQKETLEKTRLPVESSWFQGEQFTPVRPKDVKKN